MQGVADVNGEQLKSAGETSVIVVFDTNIWLQNLYLQSPAGAAARFYIRQKKVRVALPEVVRLEIEHHLRKDIGSFIDKIKDAHGRLLAVFGSLKEVILPTKDDIEKKVAETFRSLGIDFIEVPFSFESARNSFLRTIDKRPPSEKNQQFKDGVLWADCVSLLQDDDVTLVTDDKAFYEDQNSRSGLARILRDETSSLDHRLAVLPQLSDLLKEIRSDVAIDGDALTAAFLSNRPGINALLGSGLN